MIAERLPELPRIMADGKWGLPLQIVLNGPLGFAAYYTVGYACDVAHLESLRACLV